MTRQVGSHPHRAQAAPRRMLALVDHLEREPFANRLDSLRSAGVLVEFVDYRRLGEVVERLRQVVREQRIDMVLFSRNDQVFDKVSIGPIIRALGVGYSSFSGIDTPDYLEQTRTCLDDYLFGDARLAPILGEATLESGPRQEQAARGSFSLVFDLEQIGGARFGLPRILDVLDRYETRATFFTTNFIQEVYGDVAELITRRHHEIGLHGLYHEYLAGRPLNEQCEMLGDMKQGFGPGVPVRGANFMGRMDADTVWAMAASGLTYWVQFMEHRYTPFAYRRMPLRPLPVSTPHGTIWIVPISVETNNRPWFSVRNMLDSAVVAANEEPRPHVNVLLHPFRDGTREHIGDLERILVHMKNRGYRGVPVLTAVTDLPEEKPNSFIHYSLTGEADQARHVRHRRADGWHDPTRYQQRVWRLFSELEAGGARPALCPVLPDEGARYAVFPHLPTGMSRLHRVRHDPLRARDTLNLAGLDAGAVTAFVPGGEFNLAESAGVMLPRDGRDVAGLLPEVALRVAYRLTRGRHPF